MRFSFLGLLTGLGDKILGGLLGGLLNFLLSTHGEMGDIGGVFLGEDSGDIFLGLNGVVGLFFIMFPNFEARSSKLPGGSESTKAFNGDVFRVGELSDPTGEAFRDGFGDVIGFSFTKDLGEAKGFLGSIGRLKFCGLAKEDFCKRAA